MSAGLFRLLVPKSLGGEEMDVLDYLDVVQAIAYADGSAGWCLNQGAVFATTSGRAPRPLAEEVWGNPNTVVANGPPQGPKSEPTEGGYRLTGAWAFSSGCHHANWIAAVSSGSGQPPRLHLLPKEDVEFIDAWDVQGLRGTGSFSFTTHELFVPESRAMRLDVEPLETGPLYLIPQPLPFACGRHHGRSAPTPASPAAEESLASRGGRRAPGSNTTGATGRQGSLGSPVAVAHLRVDRRTPDGGCHPGADARSLRDEGQRGASGRVIRSPDHASHDSVPPLGHGIVRPKAAQSEVALAASGKGGR